MMTTFVNALMSAEADAVRGAPYGVPSSDRVNVGSGYRQRDSGTRPATLELAIPKLRQGSYLLDWLARGRELSVLLGGSDGQGPAGHLVFVLPVTSAPAAVSADRLRSKRPVSTLRIMRSIPCTPAPTAS